MMLELLTNNFRNTQKREIRDLPGEEKTKDRNFKIINYQLIISNCLFDNIAMSLSNIINDNIIKVWALVSS